ncbi:MAG: hypothetical protein ACRDFB_00365 [Rhabdochlamydiaceae bacterium]
MKARYKVGQLVVYETQGCGNWVGRISQVNGGRGFTYDIIPIYLVDKPHSTCKPVVFEDWEEDDIICVLGSDEICQVCGKYWNDIRS